MTSQADLGWAGCIAVERDPQRVSGVWVFRGTRIPVAALFENLEDDVSLAQFVELFPGVTQEQARLVLEHVARSSAAARSLNMSLRYQQNLQGQRLAILVLTTTSWPRIRQATEPIVAAIKEIETGRYLELIIP